MNEVQQTGLRVLRLMALYVKYVDLISENFTVNFHVGTSKSIIKYPFQKWVPGMW